MRITLVIASLGAGGAERVISIIANAWAAKGWPITLLRLDDGQEPPFYELSQAIHMAALDIFATATTPQQKVLNIFRRFWRIRQAIRQTQPDVVISFIDRTNIRVLLATIGLRIPVVVCERVDPNVHRLGQVWEGLRRLTYPLADRLVVQSENARRYFAPHLQRKTTIIPNPVVLPAAPAALPVHDRCWLLAMGRCVPQKGFDLLLAAFAQITEQCPDWQLVILGDGVDRPQLIEQAHRLGLAQRVTFMGAVRNPAAYLAAADLFVLSSRYEGFPNALCEAMASGLPVVSFDCPSGPREIIRPEVDGLLVPAAEVDALAAALLRLINDAPLRQRLAQRAPEIIDRFGLGPVMAQWESLLRPLVQS